MQSILIIMDSQPLTNGLPRFHHETAGKHCLHEISSFDYDSKEHLSFNNDLIEPKEAILTIQWSTKLIGKWVPLRYSQTGIVLQKSSSLSLITPSASLPPRQDGGHCVYRYDFQRTCTCGQINMLLRSIQNFYIYFMMLESLTNTDIRNQISQYCFCLGKLKNNRLLDVRRKKRQALKGTRELKVDLYVVGEEW